MVTDKPVGGRELCRTDSVPTTSQCLSFSLSSLYCSLFLSVCIYLTFHLFVFILISLVCISLSVFIFLSFSLFLSFFYTKMARSLQTAARRPTHTYMHVHTHTRARAHVHAHAHTHAPIVLKIRATELSDPSGFLSLLFDINPPTHAPSSPANHSLASIPLFNAGNVYVCVCVCESVSVYVCVCVYEPYIIHTIFTISIRISIVGLECVFLFLATQNVLYTNTQTHKHIH